MQEDKFEMTRKYDSQTKRVYRLIKSGNYKFEKICDLVTSDEDTKIAISSEMLYFSLLNCSQKCIKWKIRTWSYVELKVLLWMSCSCWFELIYSVKYSLFAICAKTRLHRTFQAVNYKTFKETWKSHVTMLKRCVAM